MPFNNCAACYVLRYDFRQKTIDAFAEVVQRELKLDTQTWLPHRKNHVLTCRQQDSINKVQLTHYTLGTATKPARKTSCYTCVCSHFAGKTVSHQQNADRLRHTLAQDLQLSIRQLFFLRLELCWGAAAY